MFPPIAIRRAYNVRSNGDGDRDMLMMTTRGGWGCRGEGGWTEQRWMRLQLQLQRQRAERRRWTVFYLVVLLEMRSYEYIIEIMFLFLWMNGETSFYLFDFLPFQSLKHTTWSGTWVNGWNELQFRRPSDNLRRLEIKLNSRPIDNSLRLCLSRVEAAMACVIELNVICFHSINKRRVNRNGLRPFGDRSRQIRHPFGCWVRGCYQRGKQITLFITPRTRCDKNQNAGTTGN